MTLSEAVRQAMRGGVLEANCSLTHFGPSIRGGVFRPRSDSGRLSQMQFRMSNDVRDGNKTQVEPFFPGGLTHLIR
jgi:hypothetical protein